MGWLKVAGYIVLLIALFGWGAHSCSEQSNAVSERQAAYANARQALAELETVRGRLDEIEAQNEVLNARLDNLCAEHGLGCE